MLLLFGLGGHRFEVFGFEDLPAIEAFDVVHAVSTGEDDCFLMLAGGLHNQHLEIRIIVMIRKAVSRVRKHGTVAEADAYRQIINPRSGFGGHFLQNVIFYHVPASADGRIPSDAFSHPPPRRLRSSESMRRVVRETRLDPANFILPLFICPGEGVRRPIGSMPPHCQLSIDTAVEECREVRDLGIGGIILFGLPESKDEEASGAYDDNGIVQRAIRAIKRRPAGSAGDHRRLQLRIHQPRALRQGRERRRG